MLTYSIICVVAKSYGTVQRQLCESRVEKLWMNVQNGGYP